MRFLFTRVLAVPGQNQLRKVRRRDLCQAPTIIIITCRQVLLKNFAKLTGDSIKFWKDIYAHPNLDDWWKARNPINFAQHIPATTNTLVVGGLFDAENVFGAWNLYKAIEAKNKNNNKIIMGPWFHGQWGGRGDGSYLGNVRFGSKTSEWYQNNIEVPFFNYHLKGKGSLKDLAEATIFFSGENNWKQFAQWPPKDMQAQNLYLQPNGQVSMEQTCFLHWSRGSQ